MGAAVGAGRGRTGRAVRLGPLAAALVVGRGRSLGAAALVAVVSYAYPVVVEPLFNDFEPMAAGPLRDDLLALGRARRGGRRRCAGGRREPPQHRAERVRLRVRRRRGGSWSTTPCSLRRHPSRCGRSSRTSSGHASAGDVPLGTLLAAVAAAAATLAVALVLTWPAALRRAGVESAADPRAAALALATVSLLAVLATPAESAISRSIESRADRHALDLARAARRVHRRRSAGLRWPTSPTSIRRRSGSGSSGRIPTAPERIAAAREWAGEHGLRGAARRAALSGRRLSWLVAPAAPSRPRGR